MKIYISFFLILFIILPFGVSATPIVCIDTFQGDKTDTKFRRTYPPITNYVMQNNEVAKNNFWASGKKQRARWLEQCQELNSRHKSMATDFRNIENNAVIITEEDFIDHFAPGTVRNAQIIEDDLGINMDVKAASGTGHTWVMPDFSQYNIEQGQTNAIPLSEAPTHHIDGLEQDGHTITHAFRSNASGEHFYYELRTDEDGIGDMYQVGEGLGTDYFFNDYIQSPIPLQLGLPPFGGLAEYAYPCEDWELCTDNYPLADYFAIDFYYQEVATGMMTLYDESAPIEAIKVHHTEEVFFYDMVDDVFDNGNDTIIDVVFFDYIIWYSNQGHYIIAELVDDEPWAGETSFSYMQYQKVTNNSLAVEYLDFTATITRQNEVELAWHTATEQNNSHFIIQKSTNGASFTNLGEQASKGNANQAYQFTDAKPASGTNYYRIQQVDNDGKTTLSKVITAIVTDDAVEQPTIVLYPNPGKDEVWFSHPADYELFNADGQLLTIGKADGVVDVAGLPVGTYFVRINGGEMVQWLKQ